MKYIAEQIKNATKSIADDRGSAPDTVGELSM